MTVLQGLRSWARALKRDIAALCIAARDPRVPWYAKLLAGAVAAYALSPIDLIPDFIPVIGYLDDVIIVPLGIMLVVRLIPPPLMSEFRAEAERGGPRPRSYFGLAFIALVWVMAGVWLAMWGWHRVSG